MQLKTILNHVTCYKSFVFESATLVKTDGVSWIDVEIVPRANGVRLCSGCGKVRRGYDSHPKPRRFEFVPMWGLAVYFVYTMRRVDCPQCGIRVEQVPWAEGKSSMTTELKWFLARWARRLSWKDVAVTFRVGWDRVYEAVKHAVSWGLEHRDLDSIESIGIDEVQWQRGHHYQTVVYQLDGNQKRLLWVGPERTAKTLLRFFRFLGKSRTAKLQFICSDMWQGYLKVIQKKAGHAVHVLDRFHVMQKIGKAINDVRAADVKQLKHDGYEPILKGARWLLLKRPENLTDKHAVKLNDLLQYNLKSIRSHLMKEDFQRFWQYTSPGWAGRFLDQWCTRAMRSKIEPMKKSRARCDQNANYYSTGFMLRESFRRALTKFITSRFWSESQGVWTKPAHLKGTHGAGTLS